VETVKGEQTELKMNFGSPGNGNQIILSDNYLEWMQKWYTIVVTAGHPHDFVEWQSVADSGNVCVRFTIFDQATGNLIAMKDVRYRDVLPDLAALHSPLQVEDPYTTQHDCFDIRVFDGGPASEPNNIGWNRISNIWISYGTMWDPLAEDLPQSVWRTARPHDKIGDAEALCNFCFSDIVSTGKQYWIKASNPDLALFKNFAQPWDDDNPDAKFRWQTANSTNLVPQFS
jgi:hypothetical protein